MDEEKIKELSMPEYEAVGDGAALRRLTPALFDRAAVMQRIVALENELIAFREIVNKMDELGVK